MLSPGAPEDDDDDHFLLVVYPLGDVRTVAPYVSKAHVNRVVPWSLVIPVEVVPKVSGGDNPSGHPAAE